MHTWGSEGDVRPFAALARGLTQRGHEVSLLYTAVDWRDYSSLAQQSGFRAQAVGARHFAENREALEATVRSFIKLRDPVKQLRKLHELAFVPVIDEMYRTSAELCRTTDVQIAHFLHHPAVTAARAATRPVALVFTAPVVPSRHYSPIGTPDLGRLLNPLLWRVMRSVLDSIFKVQVNRLRGLAGLPLVRNVFKEAMENTKLTLTAVSPALFPRPADWDPRHELCGFFSLGGEVEAWEPTPALAKLLRRHPVYFTFGSILSLNREQARESVALMTEAARLAGIRAVIQVPTELLGEFSGSDSVQYLDHAPHVRLFPHCAAVVHHGGAGTTQAATAAGCPSVVVAHGVDQYFWGKLLQRRGLAPAYLDRRSATAAKLAARIRHVIGRPAMKEKAEALGATLRAEDGVARAIQLIEEKLCLERQPASPAEERGG